MKILSKTLSIFCLIAVPVLASATSSKCMENWLARPESPESLSQLLDTGNFILSRYDDRYFSV